MNTSFLQSIQYRTRAVRRGFTLVETLVALSIFSVALVALLNVTASGSSDVNFAKNKVIASYLAQEGIEILRNIRDTSANSTSSSAWDATVTYCLNSRACRLVHGSSNAALCPPLVNGATNCPVMRLNSTTGTGYYGYAVNDPATPFTRTIRFETLGAGEIRMVVSVSWGQGTRSHTVTVAENLFAWR